MAAETMTYLTETLRAVPSANLVKAVLGAATTSPCDGTWLRDPKREERKSKLRLVGFGRVVRELALECNAHDVMLIAEDELAVDDLQVYRVPIPESFVQHKGIRGLAISLAYDPPVRASRKEYLARTFWFEVLKTGDIDEIKRYLAKAPARDESASGSEEDDDGEGESGALPNALKVALKPAAGAVEWSTLQVRRKTWAVKPNTLPKDLYVCVKCQRRFNTSDGDAAQGYALAVRLWHGAVDCNVYDVLKQTVRARQRARARASQRR